jgi:hypothetical protein
MKNIYVLPTDKETRLHNTFGILRLEKGYDASPCNKNIYITSNEEIKVGDYWIYICPINGLDYKDNNNPIVKNNLPPTWFEKLHDKGNYKKIILTTDQDLIKDGVQAIDDEFLEWFVKNPSCEEVEVEKEKVHIGWEPDYTYEDLGIDGVQNVYQDFYKIIIPKEEQVDILDMGQIPAKEEPKQETLEESAEKYSINQFPLKDFNGKQWNNHRELCKIDFINGSKWQQEQDEKMYSEEDMKKSFNGFKTGKSFEEWFEQFKNK